MEQQGYGAESITVLEGLSAVRVRPAMYIGSTDERGLHHLVSEVIDNSIDEAMAGHCDTVTVTIHMDNSVSISDNGRGIPVETHAKTDRPALEVVMTVLHAGGKFGGDSYKVSGGLHGVGVSCVNALSADLTATVYRQGRKYRQKYACGTPQTNVEDMGETDKTGTKIVFRPDETIFETTEFDADTLGRRFQELAYLNRGLTIVFTDERSGKTKKYKKNGGIASYVKESVEDSGDSPITEIISCITDRSEVQIDFALQYTEGYKDRIVSFVNNIRTPEGGTHLQGFRTGLTRAVNNYLADSDMAKKFKEKLTGDDIREGVVGVISVKVPDPQFEGQTKAKLGNSEVQGAVYAAVLEAVAEWFEKHPKDVKAILEKAHTAAKARQAAKKAKTLVRRKSALSDTALPGKLADCQSKKPEESELFIVEGDSAGGSAKQGRDPANQAILPLRGKILNIEKSSIDKMLQNKEVRSLVTAMGLGIGSERQDLSKLRYHKIFIMTDADVDGSHIRTLLLTFFFKHFQDLVEAGHLFVAQPPLYKVQQGKKEQYIATEEEMNNYLIERVAGSHAVVSGDRKFSGNPLKELMASINGLRKRYDFAEKLGISPELFRALTGFEGNIDASSAASGALDDLKAHLENYDYELKTRESIDEDEERLDIWIFGEDNYKVRIEPEFFDSAVYKKAREQTKWLTDIFGHEFQASVQRKNDSFEVDNPFNLLDNLLESAYSGINVQRYKGLGEMNPEQLWETTMDPGNRRAGRITVPDAERATQSFQRLMGDKVEPRKQFITDNALNVQDLDI